MPWTPRICAVVFLLLESLPGLSHDLQTHPFSYLLLYCTICHRLMGPALRNSSKELYLLSLSRLPTMGLLLEQEQTLQKIWVFPLSGCLLWLVYSLVYNLLFHPLCKFPGPKLAGATGLYEGYFDLIKRPGGQFVYEVERLHQVYGALSPRIFGANASSHDAGPIVRINPNELHINDISFFDELYAIGKTRDKDPQHIQIFGTPLSCGNYLAPP